MKLSKIMIIASTALAITGFARDPSLAVGVKGGLNLSHFTGDDWKLDNTTQSMRLGFNAGAFIEVPVHPIISIQPEVQYTTKGETLEKDDIVNRTWKIQLENVEVPILAKVYFPTDGDVKPFVYFGPFMGWNLSSKTDKFSEIGNFTFSSGQDLEDQTNAWEAGVAFGAGLAYLLPSGVFFLDARYTLGLTSAFDNKDLEKVYTGVIGLQVGYGFGM